MDKAAVSLRYIEELSAYYLTDLAFCENNACLLGVDRNYPQVVDKCMEMGCLKTFNARAQILHETTIKAVKTSLLTRRLSSYSKRVISEEISDDTKIGFRAPQASYGPNFFRTTDAFRTTNEFLTSEKSDNFEMSSRNLKTDPSPRYQTKQSFASGRKTTNFKDSKDFSIKTATKAVDFIMDRCQKASPDRTFSSNFRSERYQEELFESAKISHIYKSPLISRTSNQDEDTILQQISDTILRNPESAALYEDFSRKYPSQLFKNQGINQKHIYLDLIRQGNIDEIQSEIMKKLLLENGLPSMQGPPENTLVTQRPPSKSRHKLPQTPQSVPTTLIRQENKKASDAIKKMNKEASEAVVDSHKLAQTIRASRPGKIEEKFGVGFV